MTISSSTCHICLDELDFDLRYITKKCCPTKAFICNECWKKVLDTENIIRCPLCNAQIKGGDPSLPPRVMNNSFIIEIDNPQGNVSARRDLTNKLLKIAIQILLITILGFVAIITTIYFIHPESTTFKSEINFLIVRPFFWMMCPVYGFVIFCMLSLCLEVTVGWPVPSVPEARPPPFNMRHA